MRAIALRIVGLLGAIALWCGAWVVVRYTLPPAQNALMAPLLPQREGESVCLAGSFANRAMDFEDWSKAKMVPTNRLSPDGHPYMRPVPPVLKDMAVRAFTLQLVYDSRQADYDWIYNFRLAAEVEGLGTLFAAGECPWYAKDKVYGWDKRAITASTTSLFCYIDCDGGGFDLERAPGAPAMLMSFSSTGLKMKRGCGGGGTYRLRAAASDIDFRLRVTNAEACRPLEDMASR